MLWGGALVNGGVLAILGGGAATAGFVDTLAGGGGLITVPLLLLAGLPPLQVLGTNKLQGCGGTLSASLALLRKGWISAADVKPGFSAAFAGGLLGAAVARVLAPGLLDLLIPAILAVIAVYFLLAPAAMAGGRVRLSPAAYFGGAVPCIGFYDGFFGPGTGSFFVMSDVALRGADLVKASAFAKVLNFGSNFGALVVFLATGKIVWIYGCVMLAGQILGAAAGSHVMIRGGARVIRPLIVTVCFAMLVRYGWQKGYLSVRIF